MVAFSGILEQTAAVMSADATESKLRSLGYQLPPVPNTAGSYLQSVRSGHLLFLSGGLPIDGDTLITGKVGVDLDIESAQHAARLCVLGRLAVIKAEIGSLDRIQRVVALNGFVNSGPEFFDHPKVINGASDFLIEVLGDRGRHSRTALGAPALPLNAAVELNLIVEITD